MTEIDLGTLAPRDRYKLLTGVVLPRPVAWVTTQSPGGVVNAAPFSFFNMFGEDPALMVLGLQHRRDGSPNDTARNIRETGEFVVNIATLDLVEAMVATAAAYPPDQGEPEALGLKTAPSAHIGVPRLADAPVAIECRHKVTMNFDPGRDLVIGEAVGLAARDGLINTEKMYVNWDGDYPVARLFADRYARLEEIERHPIPTLD